MFKNDFSRNARAHLELGNFPVGNLVEDHHQPDGFRAEEKIGAAELVAWTFLGIQLDVEQDDRAGIEGRLLILYKQILDVP